MMAALTTRNDLELLNLIAQRRDEDAFAEIFDRYQSPAYSLASHILGDRKIAEEVVQEAMLKIWTSASSFHGGGASVKAWILQIVARQAFRALRRRKRMKREVPQEYDQPDTSEKPAGDSMVANELLTALRQHILKLDEDDRQLVALHFGGGLSQTEISESLAISQQTISYRISRIIKDLRASLSTAGFAIAIPALSAHLQEALSDGYAPPTGLYRMVRARVLARHSARVAMKAKALPIPTLAAIAIVVSALSAGAVIWIFQPASTPVVVIPAPAVTPSVQKPAPRMSHHWTFEKGPSPELTILRGGWKWSEKDKAMISEPGTWIRLKNIPLQEGPWLLKARIEALPQTPSVSTGAMLRLNGHLAPLTGGWVNLNIRKVDRTSHVSGAYISGPDIFGLLDEQINNVIEFEKDHRDCELIVMLDGQLLYDLSLVPLEESELPASVRDYKTMVEGWKRMGKASPEYAATFDDPK